MPIGTSDGQYFENVFEQHQASERIYVSPRMPEGNDEFIPMKEQGNIDLTKRPEVQTPEGTATVRSMSFGTDKGEVLVPTVHPEGRIMSDDEAKQRYYDTGEHLGIFDTPEAADRYATMLHNSQADILSRRPPQASTEPAGAFKSTEGSQTPDKGALLEKQYLKRLSGTENPRPVTDILIDFAKEKATHLIDALKAPGDAWAGKLDPMSPQGLERANTLAGLMVGGPAPLTAKMADGTLGSFAGVRSKSLDKAKLYEAQKMEMQEGAHPDDIWEKTGFMRGADNRWKYEINDRAADFKPEAIEMTNYSKRRLEEEVKNPSPKGWGEHEPMFKLPERGDKDPLKLGDIFDHPELYEAYPHLQNIDVVPVHAMDQLRGIKGYFAKDRNVLALAPDTMENLRSVTLHEIAHAIQAHEGFSTGANTNIFKTQRWNELHKTFEDFKKDVEGTVKEFFPENPGKLWDLVRSLKNEDMLGHYKKMAEEGYKHNAEVYARTKRDLELIDQVPYLRESLKKIIKGDEIVGKYDMQLYKKYAAVKGEVEARNVQERRNYTYLESEGTPPYRTEDHARENQIWSPLDPVSLRDY